MRDFELIIIGAGAAGLMCAAEAVKRGRRTLLLDNGAKVGQKIRISGGGRANFTNLHASPADFLSENPRFCVSALKRFSPHDFIALVEEYNISYHERDHGQLFCDGSAQQIIDMLLHMARGVHVQTATNIIRVARHEAMHDANNEHRDEYPFMIETDRGVFNGQSLVIATGGPSIPKMGSSGFAYGIARQFGLQVIEPRPGLVPLTFSQDILGKLDGLAGISLDATVKVGKTSFTEALLFTHRGLSGPVVLQISSYWHDGDTITINLLPGIDLFQYLKDAKNGQPKKDVRTILSHLLPKRLAQRMVEWTDSDSRLAETSDGTLRRLADHINAWRITPNGSEGMRTAEVTVGGVDTKALSSKTMETTSVPGLYFIGEAVDVTGHLGGFNFQWAWASGQACGQVA